MTTRWLDEDEQRIWRTYLTVTQLLSAQLERELQQDAGLSHSYYELLVRLSESPDRRLRLSTLATSAASSRSRLSHAIGKLESRGWIRRESCSSDGRGAFAVLTDEGFAVLEGAAPGHVAGVRRHLFDPLSDEQVAQLGEICQTVLAHLAGTIADARCRCRCRCRRRRRRDRWRSRGQRDEAGRSQRMTSSISPTSTS